MMDKYYIPKYVVKGLNPLLRNVVKWSDTL